MKAESEENDDKIIAGENDAVALKSLRMTLILLQSKNAKAADSTHGPSIHQA